LSQLERDNKKIELANRQMSDLLERQRKKLRVEPLKGVNDAAEKIPEKMSKYDIELEQLESSHREFTTVFRLFSFAASHSLLLSCYCTTGTT
jgi:hypothetical protein